MKKTVTPLRSLCAALAALVLLLALAAPAFAADAPFYAIWTVGQYKSAMSFCKVECLEACIFYACKRRISPSGKLLEGITLEWLSSCFFRDAQESRICGHVL